MCMKHPSTLMKMRHNDCVFETQASSASLTETNIITALDNRILPLAHLPSLLPYEDWLIDCHGDYTHGSRPVIKATNYIYLHPETTSDLVQQGSSDITQSSTMKIEPYDESSETESELSPAPSFKYEEDDTNSSQALIKRQPTPSPEDYYERSTPVLKSKFFKIGRYVIFFLAIIALVVYQTSRALSSLQESFDKLSTEPIVVQIYDDKGKFVKVITIE
ncbi:uncharacterized protein RJT20DRAFT_124792 [Scheffersomyces xylosifermentans]|uniref:uncharacterized protein n=1 Tax=Scheffersomyces xylosifermentans TaxID=1304137 RepID=UPI00315D8429